MGGSRLAHGSSTRSVATKVLLYIALGCLLTAPIASRGSPDSTGEQSPAYLGLVLDSNQSWSDLLEHNLCTSAPGARVVGVDHGSPAAQARIREGDLVTHANGREIRGPDDLARVLVGIAPSDLVVLRVYHEAVPREVPITTASLPVGYPGFEFAPLGKTIEGRGALLTGHALGDSLPVVTWVCGDVANASGFRRERFGVGSVVVSALGHSVRSVGALRRILTPVRVGDLISLEFITDGEMRNICYAAQPLPEPWAGLGLEEVTPRLAEAERIDDAAAAREGLFVRSVEPTHTAARDRAQFSLRFGAPRASVSLGARLRPERQRDLRPPVRAGDVLVGLAGEPIRSAQRFDQIYRALPLGETASAVVWRGARRETLGIERSCRLLTARVEPVHTEPGLRYEYTGNIGSLVWQPGDSPRDGVLRIDPLWGLPFPLYYTKAGVYFVGSGSARWDRLAGDAAAVHAEAGRAWRTAWTLDWEFGFEAERRRPWRRLSFESGSRGANWRERLVPHLTYFEGVAPFRGQRISGDVETWYSMLLAGMDYRDYVRRKGWAVEWAFGLPGAPGAIGLFAESHREEVVTSPDAKSILGRRQYEPNAVRGVVEGSLHAATLRYDLERYCPSRNTGFGVSAEIRLAGHALGGDFSFTRSEASLYTTARILDGYVWSARAFFGTATGGLPAQEEFSLGGKLTLPGYSDHEFKGDRMYLVRTELWFERVGLAQFVPFLGVGVGDAWRSCDRSRSPEAHVDVEVGFAAPMLKGTLGRWGSDEGFPVLQVSAARPIADDGSSSWRGQVSLFSRLSL
jgi:S1-C subfamily serine protease